MSSCSVLESNRRFGGERASRRPLRRFKGGECMGLVASLVERHIAFLATVQTALLNTAVIKISIIEIFLFSYWTSRPNLSEKLWILLCQQPKPPPFARFD